MRVNTPRDWKLLVVVVAALAAGDLLFQLDQLAGGDDQDRRAYESITVENNLELMPGVSPIARVVATPQGLRGDLLTEGSFNLVLSGGSTVFCRLLDEDKALTARIAAAIPGPVRESIGLRVATAGRGGQTISKSYANLARLFDDPATRPDLVVGQFGSNSTAHLLVDTQFSGPAAAQRTPVPWLGTAPRSAYVKRLRALYQRHAKLGALTPQLEVAYSNRRAIFADWLGKIVDQARAGGARLLLVTQPISYAGSALDTRTAKYLLLYPKNKGFVPTPALLAKLLDGFNQVTRDLAAERGIPLLDLAASDLATCEPCFYDQWHLTELGADRAGQQIAHALLEHGLLPRP